MILLILLSVAGWTAILTRGAGPWRILDRARAAWPGSPLGCPLCCGTWIGAIAAALALVACRWPVLADPGIVLAAAGCGALASEAYARTIETAAEIAYLARALTDQAERPAPPPAP